MPCNSDHMQAQSGEISRSRVMCMLDEVKKGTKIKSKWWAGYHPKVYCKGIPKDKFDELTSELCSLLKTKDTSKYSLELQIWWRDHQAADQARERREKLNAKKQELQKKAKSKLSSDELKALGLS